MTVVFLAVAVFLLLCALVHLFINHLGEIIEITDPYKGNDHDDQ